MARQGQLGGMDNVQPDSSAVVVGWQDRSLPLQVLQATSPLTYRDEGLNIPSILSSSSRQSQITNGIVPRHDVLNAVASEITPLKTPCYASLPISRIPSEILSVIFQLYARSAWAPFTPFGDGIEPDTSSTLKQAYSWLRIYRVCRHWRDVASACPDLWAWIIPANAALIRLALQRSSRYPLTISTIHLQDRSHPDYDLTQEFHSCWSRIRRVKLAVGSESLFADVDAPLLRSLYIRYRGSSRIPTQPLFREYGTPNLSDLAWSGQMQWDLLRPMLNPRLESLRVQADITRPYFEAISPERWLNVLQNMPSLRFLHLDRVVGSFLVEEEVKDRPPISLPNLASFRISTTIDHDSRGGDAYIFTRLDMPTSASIEYDIHRGGMADIDLDHISQRVSTHIADKQHRWMKIRYKSRAEIWNRHSTTLTFETGQALAIDNKILIGIRVDGNVPLKIFAHVCLAGITEMHIDLGWLFDRVHVIYPTNHTMLKNMFRAVPNLRSLALTGERGLQSLSTVLQSCVSQTDASASPSCVLPDLQVLTLENAAWHGFWLMEESFSMFFAKLPDRKGRSKEAVAPQDKPLLSTLVDILAARWAQGACLNTLRIRRGERLNADDVDYIRSNSCTETVDWDGVTSPIA